MTACPGGGGLGAALPPPSAARGQVKPLSSGLEVAYAAEPWPPPPTHVRISALGTLQQSSGGGEEIFDFSFANHGGQTPEEAATLAAPVLSSQWEGHSLGISTKATLTGCRAETVDETGKISSSFYVPITPIIGDAPSVLITVLSTCVTLETETPNDHGRYVRGRFYPPGYVYPIMGSTSSLGDAGYYAAAWAGFITAINDTGLVVAVASTTGGGQIADVTGVSVATVIDTVRRRRNHVTTQRTPISAV